MKRKGKVTKVGKSKFSYYVLLDNDQFYFNTKFEPKCGVGDTVGIEYDKKGDQRGQIQKMVILEDAGGKKGYDAPPAGAGTGGGNRYSGGGNDGERQASIIWQSSRKDALVLAEILVANNGIALPKDPNGRRTVIEELVDEITLRYVKDATNPKDAATESKKAEADSSKSESKSDWEDSSEDEDGGGDEWEADPGWD